MFKESYRIFLKKDIYYLFIQLDEKKIKCRFRFEKPFPFENKKENLKEKKEFNLFDKKLDEFFSLDFNHIFVFLDTSLKILGNTEKRMNIPKIFKEKENIKRFYSKKKSKCLPFLNIVMFSLIFCENFDLELFSDFNLSKEEYEIIKNNICNYQPKLYKNKEFQLLLNLKY